VLRLFSIRAFSILSAALLVALLPRSLPGQTRVKVSVDTTKILNRLNTLSLGVGLVGYDGKADDPQVVQLLKVAGVHALRYPGNGGFSGIYHFTLPAGVINPYKDGKAPYFAASNEFSAMAPFLDAFGTAIVSVDYGSSLDGTGGGEPAEAAAWVAYANGDAGSTLPLGKDSKGNDWKTVGYWAGLRAAAPLAADDGLNNLRINHPQPLGIQLWQIGNEAWNNGFYGPDHSGEFDLHAGPIPSEKDPGKRFANPRLGPAVYAAAVQAFAKAMKAVDPKILVGASFTTPTKNVNWVHSSAIGTSSTSDLTGQTANAINWGADWNNELLKTACAEIDFGAISLIEGPTLPPDYKVVDEDALLQSVNTDYQAIVVDLLDRFHKYCPSGHAPRLAFTNFGVQDGVAIPHPSIVAAFAADAVATLIETGTISIDWSSFHTPLFLDEGNKPRPAYYGYQMVHILAYQPGDAFVATQSNISLLSVHATKRRDGSYGLLLINKDPRQSAQVAVHFTGDTPAAKGIRFDYNEDALKADKGLNRSPLDNLGASFSVDVPPYTTTAILIPKAQ
jgi:hypothetical protein